MPPITRTGGPRVPPVELLLVRHGESTWNALGRWQGRADPPLTDAGERQAAEAGRRLRPLAPRRVLSSPLRRAFRTAELLDLGEPEPADWLQERDAGAWQGLTRDEIEQRWPGWLAEGRRPEGWEGDDALVGRVRAGLDTLRAVPGPLLLVAHGGVILALERLAGLERERLPNLGGRRFLLEGDELRGEGPRLHLVEGASAPTPRDYA